MVIRHEWLRGAAWHVLAGTWALALVVLSVLASEESARAGSRPLTVLAASSLTEAFASYDDGARYSFGSSGALETQIREGAPADLFASASPRNAQRLYGAGLVERPVTFAAGALALIVPRSNPARISAVSDLGRASVKLVVAAPSVPAGSYTGALLRALGLGSVLANVVSREPDVKAVIGKVALGQADAGFVYATDARAAGDRVKVISIPVRAQPDIRYQVAVVARSPQRARARAWVRGLLGTKGQAALRRAGFLPAPVGRTP